MLKIKIKLRRQKSKKINLISRVFTIKPQQIYYHKIFKKKHFKN